MKTKSAPSIMPDRSRASQKSPVSVPLSDLGAKLEAAKNEKQEALALLAELERAVTGRNAGNGAGRAAGKNAGRPDDKNAGKWRHDPVAWYSATADRKD